MATGKYISVILPLRIEWEPWYALTDGMTTQVGDRVRVRFAHREYVGVVSRIDETPEISLEKIQSVISLENGLERILRSEIELWRQVADYYLCTIGEVYKAAYPSVRVDMEEARGAARMKVRQRREAFLQSIRNKAGKLEARLARKNAQAAKARKDSSRAAYLKEAENITLELLGVKELLESYSQNDNGRHPETKKILSETYVDLTDAQRKAYEEICESFRSGKPVLLNGVTGSGKTEIYIKLAQETIREGGNVLYLVPEIALSRQLEDRLYDHFGEGLMTYHSGETAASRRNTAESIRECQKKGTSYIVLGTRSSLFLPHNNLGLIIVDEEHDSSYKQDSPAPRYNGRDTALMLSVIQDCNVILGSATPSLEELYNCSCGKHSLVSLKERYHGSGSSDIEIIDTKAERRKNGMCGSFSRKLIAHINSTLAEGGQVMIICSRRSWAPAIQCEECGGIMKCPRCNVSLSHHKSGDRSFMLCHYCGWKAAYNGRCSCGGDFRSMGAGTQKIEEEAATLFPDARIARLDSDTNQNKGYSSKTIKAFGKGEVDILIGTQILGKGFDFSNLRMVALIAADTLLGIQDFRADEKAMQLLEQFRGRCGRRESKGLFAIQTSQPEHPVYQRIAGNKATDFNMELLAERQEFNFPPFFRTIEITIRDRYEDRADRMAKELSDGFRRDLASVTGPYAPAVDKVADLFIRKIRISLRKDRWLKSEKSSLLKAVNEFEKIKRYDGHISIDVDPA